MNRYLKAFLFISAGVFILRIPSLYQHIIDIDETVFSEFARVILDGGLPYVSVVDNKPPLTYYFFTFVYYFAGSGSLLVVHAVTTIWVSVTGFFVYLFSVKLSGEKAGIASAALFVLLMHTYEPKYISTNGETLINLFIVISAFIFLKFRRVCFRNIVIHGVSGLLLGLAVMTNYKAGILAFVYIVYSLVIDVLIHGQNRITILRENIIRLFVTGLASLVPVGLLALMFHVSGNFSEALFWGFLYNFGYIESGGGSSLKILVRTGYFVLLSLPAWLAVVKHAAGYYTGLHDEDRDDEDISRFAFMLLWLAGSVYAATLGGRGYGHYFIQVVPPLAIAAVMCAGEFRQYGRVFWVWLAVPVVIMTAARLDIQRSYLIAGDKNAGWKSDYTMIADYIKKNTVQGETVYVWGWATPVYYYADRRSASRFVISDFVSGRVFGTGNESSQVRAGMASRFMHLLMDDLAKNRPAYFVDTSPSGYFGYNRFPLSLYPELDRFVKENYLKESEIDGIVIYRRH